MLGETENQFSLTRAALSTSGAQKQILINNSPSGFRFHPGQVLVLYFLLSAFLYALPAHAQLSYETNNGTLTVTGYTGPGGNVIIPSNTYGLLVLGVANSAFSSRTTLNSIVIPGSVTSLGDSAFYGCSSLTNAWLGSGVDIGPIRSGTAPSWPAS